MKNAGEAGKGFFAGVKSKTLSILEFCKKGCLKIISTCKKVILAPFVFFKGLFTKKEKDVQESVIVTEKVKKKRGIFSMVLSFIKGMIRLFRKIFYGCLLLLFGCCSIALILALGFLTVLLLLGYPIVGITLSTFGIAMSASAVTYFAAYRWRRV